jgi:hypothetical protein
MSYTGTDTEQDPYIANTLIFDDNKLNLMVGITPVQRAYLGSELVWERGGINKIITDSLINMIHNNS